MSDPRDTWSASRTFNRLAILPDELKPKKRKGRGRRRSQGKRKPKPRPRKTSKS
jgi:hypothetical protein